MKNWSIVLGDFVVYWNIVRGDLHNQIDSSKVSVLPPALIGVLLAYAKWKDQRDAVKYGGSVMIVLAPFVAVMVIPIVNFPTFVVAGAIGVRHIPWRSRSDWGRNLFFAGFLFSVVPWLMLETLGPDQMPRYALWVFLSLFGGAILVSLTLFVIENFRGTLVFVGSLLLAALMLVGLWSIIMLIGLDKSHPAIAEAIVYIALILVIPVLVLAGVMRGKVSFEPRQSQ